VLSRKKAWLITAALAGFIYLAVYLARLFIPLLESVDPYDDRTIWLHALVFLPFVLVLGLFLVTAVLRKLTKFATFIGTLAVYAPLIMMIINGMAVMSFFPIVYMLMPLFELETELRLEHHSSPFFDSAIIEEMVPVLIAIGAAITIVGLVQIVRARRNNCLATDGLYATVRHPQHLGIAIWALGFTLGGALWLHFFFWLTLVYVLVLLALNEEGRLKKQFRTDYVDYQQRVPFMIPLKLPDWCSLPTHRWKRAGIMLATYIASITAVSVIYLVL
jgi:protein-S-isoprenylcysteine O-methyltransferase Ste14